MSWGVDKKNTHIRGLAVGVCVVGVCMQEGGVCVCVACVCGCVCGVCVCVCVLMKWCVDKKNYRSGWWKVCGVCAHSKGRSMYLCGVYLCVCVRVCVHVCVCGCVCVAWVCSLKTQEYVCARERAWLHVRGCV